MPESKAQARTKIDQALQACGWSVQPYRDFAPSASCGIALTEVPLKIGTPDYLLLVEQKRIITDLKRRLSIVELLEMFVSANCKEHYVYSTQFSRNHSPRKEYESVFHHSTFHP